MLVALSVKNFKSIRDARIHLGPFTCFIGHNGVGKSNLFDAIHFLSELAERDVSEAAADLRNMSDGGGSPLDLVFGRDENREIELSADMIVPPRVTDDFGEQAKPAPPCSPIPSSCGTPPQSDRLLVAYESLTHAKLGDYNKFVGFKSSSGFRASAALGSRRGGALSQPMTTGSGSTRRRQPGATDPRRQVAADSGRGNQHLRLSDGLAAKREMTSWKVLHLEPSAMRTPDSRSARPRHVSASGAACRPLCTR